MYDYRMGCVDECVCERLDLTFSEGLYFFRVQSLGAMIYETECNLQHKLEFGVLRLRIMFKLLYSTHNICVDTQTLHWNSRTCAITKQSLLLFVSQTLYLLTRSQRSHKVAFASDFSSSQIQLRRLCRKTRPSNFRSGQIKQRRYSKSCLTAGGKHEQIIDMRRPFFTMVTFRRQLYAPDSPLKRRSRSKTKD